MYLHKILNYKIRKKKMIKKMMAKYIKKKKINLFTNKFQEIKEIKYYKINQIQNLHTNLNIIK